MKTAFRLLLASLSLMMVGCGGGGSSTNSGPLPALAVHTRLYNSGDTWNYTVSGTARGSNNQTRNLTGTVIVTMTSVPLGNRTYLAETVSGSFTLSDGNHLVQNNITYFLQNGDGSLTAYADNKGTNNAIRYVTNPQQVTPGTWQDNLSINTTLIFDNFTQDQETFTITGREYLTTQVGTLAVWKASDSETQGALQTIATRWDAPQVGEPVKFTVVGSDNQGVSVNYTANLTSTNVPLN